MTNRRLFTILVACFFIGISAAAVGRLFAPRTQVTAEDSIPAPPPSEPPPLTYQPAVSSVGRVLAYLPASEQELIPISLERPPMRARYWTPVHTALGNNPSVHWPANCPVLPVRKVWADGDTLNVTLDTPDLTVVRDYPSLLLALRATVAEFGEFSTVTVYSLPRSPRPAETLTSGLPGPPGYGWTLVGGEARVTATYSADGAQLSRIVEEIIGSETVVLDSGPDGLSCTIAAIDDPNRVRLAADIVVLTAQARGIDARVFHDGTEVAVDDGRLHPNPVAACNTPPRARVAFLGDVSLGRRLTTLMTEHGTDYPFGAVAEHLAPFDLVIANLESPVSDRGTPLPGKGIWLRARPEHAEALNHVPVDVVNIANNHMLDYDSDGLTDTITTLDRLGIIGIGAGSNLDRARDGALFEVNGLRIGIIGYTRFADIFWSYSYPRTFAATADRPGVAPLERELIVSDLERIASECDIMIVSLHWGEEDTHYPTPDQRELAARLVHTGAHVIMGHHPHVMQGIERIGEGVVLYSLGNFVYDQYRQANVRSLIAGMELTADGVGTVEVQPVLLVQARPTIPSPDVAQHVLSDLAAYSRPLGTTLDVRDAKALILR